MSLILRKKCQDLLDSNGMSKFHVGINSVKQMEIQTECGKSVCTIKGVSFSRAIPNMGEIDYAVELMDAFIGTHRKVLKAYLKQFDIVAGLKEIKNTTNITIVRGSYNNTWNKFTYEKNNWRVVYYLYPEDRADENHVDVSYNKDKVQTLKDVRSPKLSMKMFDEVVKIHHLRQAQDDERTKLKEISAELSTCNI